MTLTESVMVTLALVALVATVFMKTKDLKKRSDQTACLNNISNMQLIVRSFQRLHNLAPNAPLNIEHEFVGPDKAVANRPHCPSAGHYTYASTIPPLGSLALNCSLATQAAHQPPNYQHW